MARIRHDGEETGVAPVWRLALTAPGAAAPSDLTAEGWIAAAVPGTAAAALASASHGSLDAPLPLHDQDVWYRTTLEGHGPRRLTFEGLATLAEVWLDGERVAASDSMFRPLAVDLHLSGRHDLAVVFRALAPHLAKPAPRGRWRPMLATPGSLRNVRTTLVGHMPGWCPAVAAVGPYRPVTCRPPEPFRADLRTDLDGTTGRLALRLTGEMTVEGPAILRCGGAETSLARVAPDELAGTLDLPGIAPWWPHTHGTPALHAVTVEVAGRVLDLGRVGFRRIAVDRGPDGRGFGLVVNGVPIFCRGAVWTPPDLVGLPTGEAAFAPTLDLARRAGMNMLRVGGTTLYEADAFYRRCDALGILVWQDAMLANFDYPADDPAFRASVAAEVEAFLDRTQASPCLAVLCGGSETGQQPAMLGFPEETWSSVLTREVIPAVARGLRPDIAYVESSPSGGDLPFAPDAGVTHYYGVGAYRRPLSDARDAGVRFAAECLGFSNLPEAGSPALAGLPALDDPAWRARVPRDRGTDWDFEDVRDHYCAALYGVDPVALRRDDPERYALLSRAVVAQVMEGTFAAWRRGGSPTRGGLVWHLTDLAPGAGWGVIDAAGRPKSAWWALARAFRPLGVAVADEGLSGLAFHAWNEAAEPREAVLDFACLSEGGRIVASATRPLTLAPRETATLTASAMLGRFFDTSCAYRFGPPAHALTHARLLDPQGGLLAEAFHFPQNPSAAPRDLGLSAALSHEDGTWVLDLACERLALGVHLEDAGFRPDDAWFPLVPGRPRRLRLAPLAAAAAPRGLVRALNSSTPIAYGDPPR